MQRQAAQRTQVLLLLCWPHTLLHAVSCVLGSPIGPYDGDALALAYLQVHVLEQQPVVVAVAQALGGGG